MASRVEQETWREALMRSAPDGSLAHLVLTALGDFLRTDVDLLIRDVNERTITGRLADHLRGQLPEWNVDCAYNRDGHHGYRNALFLKLSVGRRTPDVQRVQWARKNITSRSGGVLTS